ncbi:response regulator [Paenibacillus sp. N4]|uniref:ATP-binding protein n=1 Tax=Paenibacillus vietnamensis TaxID=2590547 RepID=UPI001CD159B0|nr:ATP-binding protein [Paenibacillus vietnamensis]MCA0754310.1 response regulator [Paenibacillus vietnamensis]
MSKLRHFYKRSITQRLVSMMMLAVMLILFGAFYMLWTTYSIVQDYMREAEAVQDKLKLVSEIADHSNEIILRARGYFVYLSDYEYEQIFAEEEKLKNALLEIKKRELSEAEMEVMQNIEAFFTDYFETTLPKAIAYAEAEDYGSLRQLITADEDNPVNKLIVYAYDFENQVKLIAEEKNGELVRQLALQAGAFITYILAVLILSSFITRKLGTDMGAPLRQLTKQARRFAEGERFELESLTRADEIGELSRSLQSMMGQIHLKEETLLAQNEELQAQQDELQAQQEELQRALALMEKNERYLEKRNQLIQSLSNTLNQTELLQSIIQNMVEITESDKGILIMMKEPHPYASVGLSEEAAKQAVATLDEGIALRALQTKKTYRINRAASTAERGYHTAPMSATDLVVPVAGADEEMVACLILTKLGRDVSRQEEAEIDGLIKQVSLSFDKLVLFEQSEKRRQMIGDMLNTVQEGIQFTDLHGTTLQINRRMSELLGVVSEAGSSTRLPIDSFLETIREKVIEPERLVGFITRIVNGELTEEGRSMNYELSLPERKHIQIYCEPLYRQGDKFGLLFVHRDISKEYEVDRMKSEFVSTVSHELRTPLASVLGFAELLIHRELNPERQRKYMMTIYQEAKRLTALINDFLDLQRMESGKQIYDMQAIDIASLIEEIVETEKLSGTAHRIEFCNRAPKALVWADAAKLGQAFINLLNNAVKYSPDGGTILIDAAVEDEQLVIRIQDEGLGIPEEALPKLFSKFYRVDNSDRREIGGTGLGLAIVKEIINRHKGTIGVESVFGSGSTFTVRLPAITRLEHSAVEDPERKPEKASLLVALVENDHHLSLLLTDELQASGYRVHLFAEGRQALDELERLNPDAVVIDLMLEQGLTGWDIITMMKKSEKLLNKPILISSAFEEKEKAAAWGISEFLVKPYLPGRLSERLSDLILRSEERHEKG